MNLVIVSPKFTEMSGEKEERDLLKKNKGFIQVVENLEDTSKNIKSRFSKKDWKLVEAEEFQPKAV